MIEYADVVVGLAWGDEAKGKITSYLAEHGEYDMVARWSGGNNAGHTVFKNGKPYKTHLVPSGVFNGRSSLCFARRIFYERIGISSGQWV